MRAAYIDFVIISETQLAHSIFYVITSRSNKGLKVVEILA